MNRRKFLATLGLLATALSLGCLRAPGWRERHDDAARDAWERKQRERMHREHCRAHPSVVCPPKGERVALLPHQSRLDGPPDLTDPGVRAHGPGYAFYHDGRSAFWPWELRSKAPVPMRPREVS